jgi:hypothetical protein
MEMHINKFISVKEMQDLEIQDWLLASDEQNIAIGYNWCPKMN